MKSDSWAWLRVGGFILGVRGVFYRGLCMGGGLHFILGDIHRRGGGYICSWHCNISMLIVHVPPVHM